MTMKTMYWVSGIVRRGCWPLPRAASRTNRVSRACGRDGIHQVPASVPGPTPEQQQGSPKCLRVFVTGIYPDVLADLAQLSADASLTDAQKKAVNDLTEGINQTMTNTPRCQRSKPL